MDSKAWGCIASLTTSDKPTWHFTKIDNWNRELAVKDESVATKQKPIMLEMEILIEHNWCYRIANHGNINTASLERLDMQLREFSII